MSAKDIQVGGDHYKNLKIQPVSYITENGLGYLEGNVIKYVTRYKSKNGKQDLLKARHYIDMLLEQYDGTTEKQESKSEAPAKCGDTVNKPPVCMDIAYLHASPYPALLLRVVKSEYGSVRILSRVSSDAEGRQKLKWLRAVVVQAGLLGEPKFLGFEHPFICVDVQ